MEDELLQRRKLAEMLVEAGSARAELARQADASRDIATTRENAIRSLDSQVQEHRAEVDRLESLLKSEIARRRREHSQAVALNEQNAELTDRLAEKAAAEQVWRQRESELERSIRGQKDQIANAAAAALVHEAEINDSNGKIGEFRLLQSALCAQVRELTARYETSSERIQELDGQLQAAEQRVQARDQELAVLRYAILDAARMEAKFNRERLQVQCQSVEGLKHLASTLLHTPLSLAQRGLVAQINAALDGWKNKRAEATNGVVFQVEPPPLRPSEFRFEEVTESALAAVRKMAAESGTKVQAAIIGSVPETAYGNAEHIHQLITMLAGSLREVTGAGYFDLKVSLEADQTGIEEMLLEMLVPSTGSAGKLCARLKAITSASVTLQSVQFGEAESALAAAWQLALALGGSALIEKSADQEVRVRISLPIGATSPLLLQNQPRHAEIENHLKLSPPSASRPAQLAANGNSNGHGNGFGNGNGHHEAVTLAGARNKQSLQTK